AGTMDHAAFLRKFGHRGHNEMELAQPRWSEDPHELDQLIKQQRPAEAKPQAAEASPFANDKLIDIQRRILEQHLQMLHTHLALRETGKHHLMRGYALIRRILVELDRRCRLDGGIFFLTLEELPA